MRIGTRVFNTYDRAAHERQEDNAEKIGRVFSFFAHTALGHTVSGSKIKTAGFATKFFSGIAAVLILPFTLLGVALLGFSESHKQAHKMALKTINVAMKHFRNIPNQKTTNPTLTEVNPIEKGINFDSNDKAAANQFDKTPEQLTKRENHTQIIKPLENGEIKIKFDGEENEIMILSISEKEELCKESKFFNALFNGNFKEKGQPEIHIQAISKRDFEIMKSLIDQYEWQSEEEFDIENIIHLYQKARQFQMKSSIRIIKKEIKNFIHRLGYSGVEIDCVIGIKSVLEDKDLLNKTCHDYFLNYILKSKSIPNDISVFLKETNETVTLLDGRRNISEDNLDKLGSYYPNIIEIDFHGFKYDVYDHYLETVCKAWLNLKALDLSLCEDLSTEGLKHLLSLKDLEKLNHILIKITDSDLKSLVLLTNLQKLFLGHCKEMAGLKHLEPLTNLRKQYLDYCNFTNTKLIYLEPFSNLQELVLSCCEITGAGLKHIKSLTKLQKLDIIDCKTITEGI